ncbi:EAL domain-containing protein [Octadecabacter sp. CECT 8868]|uniref:putative bifunctional diguanylate cyclase/phosphodiesterase n=1 Tax=Octadecabacter algicola TaxID=2909342 RepID=UPI001F22080D|nr:bifunctional diguanylate cyclase/phosphodiesterase [Octadecabacter algicola]MCF2903410.1 EAL domain-containing protein [Octadecabacter algicola]
MTKVSSLTTNLIHRPDEPIQDFVPFDLAQRLDAAVWVFDIDNSRIARANAAACRLWRASSEEDLKGRDLSRDMSSTVAKRLLQYQADFTAGNTTFTELWTLYPSGEPESVMVVYSGYRLEDGRMAMMCEALGQAEDQPDNLRSAEALLHTDVMITLFSRDGPPLYMNPAARNAFKTPVVDFARLFVEPTDCDELLDQMERLGEYRLVSRMNTARGQRWFDVSAKKCSDAVTGQPAILMTAIDVSELKEARDTARHLADRDQLTNLHNRTFLQNHLSTLYRVRPDTPCALIFFDVDRFKLINDRYGHEAGDTVLKQIALRTRATLRAHDMIARLGGDEFVVLIEDVHDRASLEAQISRLRLAISRPILHNKTRIDARISVGVASFFPRKGDQSDVLREADIALYASKQSGRDKVTYFTPEMGVAAKARDRLEIELRHAVENEEFVLYYQPRLDIETGKIIGAEGLARWMHPERGVLLPDSFIPICEETGLIEELGRLVLEVGCRQAIDWARQGRDLSVSLNVSPRQFSDPGFINTLTLLATDPDFPTGKIELEVTETVLIGDHDLIAGRLRAITAMGYRLAIDDFGTGYSNLSYISRFPLTCLKIDRSFISQLPESGPIVQLILTLGQQLGATVVSEGVETAEQLAWLSDHNCDEAQGYYITAPLPVPEFEAFTDRLLVF